MYHRMPEPSLNRFRCRILGEEPVLVPLASRQLSGGRRPPLLLVFVRRESWRAPPPIGPAGRRCYQVAAGYNRVMPRPRYTEAHAEAGLNHKFPAIETWPNQFSGYEIVVDDPEFTSVCPKTSLPDFGTVTIRYMPDKLCLELKSLKEYLQSYRNLGIFQENIVNRVLEDVVRWAKPVWAEVKGDFRPRGGISTVVVARWPRPKGKKRR
jgi:7-cyano-7-deazaguanine reductase